MHPAALEHKTAVTAKRRTRCPETDCMLTLSRRFKRNPRNEARRRSDDLLRIEYTPTIPQSMPGRCTTFRRLQMSNTSKPKSIGQACIVLKQRQLRSEHGRPEQRRIGGKGARLLRP